MKMGEEGIRRVLLLDLRGCRILGRWRGRWWSWKRWELVEKEDLGLEGSVKRG